jgi:hypothetical protein
MRTRLVLFLWILGILFPLAWLGHFSLAYRRVFDTVFGSVWMHVLMHSGLFAGLVILLVIALRLPNITQTFWIALCVILLVGVLQETFQALTNSYFSLPGAALDMGVDLFGGMVGFSLTKLIRGRRGENNLYVRE